MYGYEKSVWYYLARYENSGLGAARKLGNIWDKGPLQSRDSGKTIMVRVMVTS